MKAITVQLHSQADFTDTCPQGHEDGQKYTYTLVQLLRSMSYDFVG